MTSEGTNKNNSAVNQMTWSPFSALPIGPDLSPSGLLQLDSDFGEVELVYMDHLQLRVLSGPLPMISSDESMPTRSTPNLEWIDRDSDLMCTLTTHRIIFSKQTSNARISPRFIHLSMISNASQEGGGMLTRASYKIILSTYSYGEVQLVLKHPSYATNAKYQQEAFNAIQKSLKRRAWEEVEREKLRQKSSHVNNITKKKVGVDAIMAKNKARHKEAARISDKAFSGDTEKLITEAKELVNIIHKYVATLESSKQKKSISNSQHSGGTEEQDNIKLTNMLQSMGMTSALSKKKYTGNIYFDQLARQIADFLKYQNRLKEAGGMMTLTDVYCLFNRARATNFISPDDLLNVLPLLKDLNLGMSKREFNSGVIVIQDDEHDDDKMSEQLLELATSNRDLGITALDASRYTKISTILVNEHLQTAENKGVLCRDVTLEGTRFFPNYFLTNYEIPESN